jgi:zinc protease
MNIEQITLSNGLRTLFIDSPGSTVTTAQIWFKAGSSLENNSNRGIAHFLEHMFFKGTKKYPGTMIAKTVESYGGEINAFTSFDYTCYYINGPANNAVTTVDVLMDMVSNPTFLEEELVPERGVVFEEYRRSIDNPSQFNFFKLQGNSFPKEYKHPILGTEKSIKSFSRQQLTQFRNEFYNKENSMLIIAGNLNDKKKILKKLEGYSLPSGKKSEFAKFQLKSKPGISIHEKSVNQATLILTIQSPQYSDEKSPIEDLAVNCLGYGDLSPLYKDMIADSSIGTSVSGSTMFFSKGGCHFIKAAFPVENFDKALNQFKKTIINTFKTGFSSDDIDRIKNQYIASKIYEKESVESFAFSLGHGFAQSGDIHCEEEFIKNMKAASKSQVNQALLDLFARNIHITLQLPEKTTNKNFAPKLEKFAKQLNTEASKKIKSTNKYKTLDSAFDPQAKCLQISKNIKLIYRQNKMAPTFAFHTYLKGGIAHENELNNGIHNLIAKNITYGYKGITYEKLKEDLEKKSSYINGFSGKNAYGMTLHGLTEHNKSLFQHFFSLLLEPSFPNNYLSVEKELLTRALFLQKEDPVKQCFKEYNKMVFNNHPYSLDMIGSEKSLKKINRNSLLKLHSENITNNEIVLTYCGNLELESLLENIEPYLAKIKNPKRKSIKAKNIIKPLTGQTKNISFDREQTHIMIGRPTFKVGTKQDLLLKMFTTFLSGQSSELFVEVRDKKGLCYSVQPIQHTALEAGYWGIYIGAGNDKVEQAISAIMDIINKYKKKGFTQKQFNSVKKMIQGQNLIAVQTNDDYANFYSIGVLHNLGFDFQHNSFASIEKSTLKEFNDFITKFLDVDWNIVKVGKID